MSQTFAALESRLNQAVFAHLPNADASAYTASGQLVQFGVIFDAAWQGVLDGMAGDVAPTALCQDADITGVAWGDGITINGDRYTVATLHPDGTGLTRLTLRQD